MSDETSTTEPLVADHRRGRLLRVATAYALVTWVLLQLGEITFEPLKLPAWSLTALIWVLVLGFPIAMMLAWLFERGSKGFRRTADSTLGSTLSLVAGVVVIDALAGYWLFGYYAGDPALTVAETEPQPAPVAQQQAPPNSIAVLPFVDLSPENNQQYFSDGISEEILNVLAQSGLSVAGRTSSFALRGDARDIREIGQLLNVATVLEGSVRKAGDSVRVTAQLIDTSNGFHLWSNNYDRKLVDIFKIQDEIAAEIVNELVGSYEGFARAPTQAPAIASFEAYDLYLQGRDLWQRRTPASLTEAVAVFKRTLELDPAYALAYSGLADAYLLLANYGNLNVAEAIQLATPLIQTALELDGQMSEGFASLGLMYWNLGRFSAAETHLRRAIKLDPDNTTAAMWLGTLIGGQGRLGEELLILGQALDKDPLNPLININLADSHLRRGEYQAGMDRLEQMLAVYPTSTPALRTLASWSAGYGKMEAALGYASRALAVAPEEPSNQAVMAQLLLDVGALEPARTTLEAAMSVGADNLIVVQAYARYLMVAGHLDKLRTMANARMEAQGESVVASQETLLPINWLARISLLEGAGAEAANYLDQVLADTSLLPPGEAASTLTWSAAAHRMIGDEAGAEQRTLDAERILEQLRLQGMADPDIHYLEACVAALRNDAEKAMEKLSDVERQGWVNLWEVEHDVRLSSLHSDLRYDRWINDVRQRNAAARNLVSERDLAVLAIADPVEPHL
jgi:TolB-like protein/Tfp pilus assembly protein PilF